MAHQRPRPKTPPEELSAAIIRVQRWLVSVCAWCPSWSRRRAEAWALRQGRRVSHGICPDCARRVFGYAPQERNARPR